MLFLALNATPVRSCDCAIETNRKAFTKASDVFVGKVLEIKDNENYDPNKSILAFKIRLKVVKRWKGAKKAEITIFSTNGPFGTCGGFTFQKDEEYLIYAQGKNKEVTTFCSNNRPADDKYAQEAIRELENSRVHFKARVWPF